MKKTPLINYLTPGEIIDNYPQLKYKHNWSENLVGSLLRSNLLKGYYDRTRRASMIEESSVMELIQFLNNKIEAQKITL